MANAPYPLLLQKLSDYKKKYYRNLLIRGAIITTALLLSAFLVVNTLEYFGRFDTLIRGVLFFLFLGLALYASYHWVLDPILKLFNLNRQISNEEAARQIGFYFKDINDKLVNAIQLYDLNSSQSELIRASIDQKTKQLSLIPFTEAVDTGANRRYLRYIIPPAVLILIILFAAPQFFTESSARIINFRRTYVPAAPFSFQLKNKTLQVFKNEDYTVRLALQGNALPESVYLISNGRRYKMTAGDNRNYEYTFSKIQKPFDFNFEAAGFYSENYEVQLITRPNLKLFNARLNYPEYLKRPTEKLNNVGNLLVPEGTQIQWEFFSADTDSVLVFFESEGKVLPALKQNDDVFEFSKKAAKSQSYQVKLKNEHGFNREAINYYLEVIPDQHPKISVETFRDTTLFNYLVFGGNIADDYGFTRLAIQYEVIPGGEEAANRRRGSIPLAVNREQTLQNFYHQWPIDQLKLQPGDRIEYFVQVWDNDGVNGPKSTRSSAFAFDIPSMEKLEAEVTQSNKQAENKINSALSKASSLKKDIAAVDNRLKSKKALDYQDKKALEDLLKKRNDLVDELKQLQKQMEDLNKQQQRFDQFSPQMMEKMEQLQKLMDNLLDDETKKLYEELKKLLENNRNPQDAQKDLLEKLNKKEGTLEKEVERALEMFKQLQFEQKLENQIKDLKEMAKEQEQLSKESLEKNNEQQKLKDEQQKLNEKFEQNKEELNQLEELNKSLEDPNELEDTSPAEQEISEEQQQSMEQLNKGQNKKASESQKKAAQKMQKMAEQLSEMQEGMSMEQDQENLDNLRDILENLIKLSFDQEKVMKDFRNVNLSDPRFQKLSQEQLKLKDDGKIIEDSLYSLAKRVFQIESFVTREVSAMKEHMDGSVKGIRERKMGYVSSEQQLAMTSMNNLALLLNDVLKQMQEQMAQAKSGKSGKKSKSKPNSPGMSEIQRQLNERIESLKQSGKGGRELSEELAKLAAEQEMLRKALQEFEKAYKQDKNGTGGNMEELIKKMEETEKELVNKNINQKTLDRQKDILTRLLESEKAMKQQEEEERREAQQAKDKPKPVPPQLEKYMKNKENQIDLLKTIPPSLAPYYKREVDEYFKKIE
jgi:hypothetical protein